jgi:hypothetical protein
MARIHCKELDLTITFRYGYINGRRATACYLEADDGRWWGGVAECSRKDRFVKETGRQIALQRAATSLSLNLCKPCWVLIREAYEIRKRTAR